MNSRYKLLLLGNSMVGKTSIAERLARGTFKDNSDSTIGASYFLIKRDNLSMDLWDTAGQERYLSIISWYYRDADVILLVYDVTDLSSTDRVHYYIDKIQKELDKDYRLVIVGNKYDIAEEKSQDMDWIDKRIRKEFEKYESGEKKIEYIMVSAKTKYNIDKLMDIIINSCKQIKKINIVDNIVNFKKNESNQCFC